MLEYKVIRVKVKDAENTMNELAREGWRMVSMLTDIATCSGSLKGLLIVTMERQISVNQLL